MKYSSIHRTEPILTSIVKIMAVTPKSTNIVGKYFGLATVLTNSPDLPHL